jgi:hypothetical protein
MDIFILALLSGISQLAAHYIPWQRILRRQLKRTEAYVIGVVLMMIPVSVWLVLQQDWQVLLALWCVVTASGLAVMGAYALDGYLHTREQAQAVNTENQIMREQYFDTDDQRC